MKRTLLIVAVVFFLVSSTALSEEKIFRIGMIGLDTSHVTAFTGEINNNVDKYHCKVVAAFKGGSPDVESSANRVDNFTKQLQEKFGVEIVDTIEELCTKVDGIMLESVDGRPHLKQAKPVIAAGLPLFIDKPIAGNLADVLEIFRLAKEAKVSCWSSSSLRYTPGVYTARTDPNLGGVVGCDTYGPCSLEPHHPDLYWYGVHTAEMLFTVMGPDCETVCRTQTDGFEFVVGKWKDGRIGTFRGIRQGKSDYGATIFGKKEITNAGKYPGYKPLVEEVIKFFKTKEVPVPTEETIAIFAFMSAADESKAKGGVPISIKEVIEQAKLTNTERRK